MYFSHLRLDWKSLNKIFESAASAVLRAKVFTNMRLTKLKDRNVESRDPGGNVQNS